MGLYLMLCISSNSQTCCQGYSALFSRWVWNCSRDIDSNHILSTNILLLHILSATTPVHLPEGTQIGYKWLSSYYRFIHIYICTHIYTYDKCIRGLCFSSVQSLTCVWLSVTPWTAAHQASLSITNSRSLLKLMSIESVMPSNRLILCHPLLLLPSIFPSIKVFTNESLLCIRWPKYGSFSFSISPSNEYSGLISFRMDWLGLLAVQGTLKSLLQHHSLKAPVLQHSAFFIVQLSHPYMTIAKIMTTKKKKFF